jgi:hypothetical protein
MESVDDVAANQQGPYALDPNLERRILAEVDKVSG